MEILISYLGPLIISLLPILIKEDEKIHPSYRFILAILVIALGVSIFVQNSMLLSLSYIVYSIVYFITLLKKPSRILQIFLGDSLFLFVAVAVISCIIGHNILGVPFFVALVNVALHLLFYKEENPFVEASSENDKNSCYSDQSSFDLYVYTAEYIKCYLGKNKFGFGENIFENVESLLKQSSTFFAFANYMMEVTRQNSSSTCNYVPKMNEIPLSMQREAGRVIMMLSLCRSGRFQDNVSDLATTLRLFPISKSVRLNLLRTYQSLERYKALALLMKRMTTISGIASEAENKCAYKFFSHYRSKRINSMPVSSYLRMVYDYTGGKQLKQASDEAMKYLFLFDKKELDEFISALFKVAAAEDGIVLSELSFVYRCAAHAGFSDAEFLSFCRCFHVKWTKAYEGENIYGGEEEKKRFFADRESFWKQMETDASRKRKNSQKKEKGESGQSGSQYRESDGSKNEENKKEGNNTKDKSHSSNSYPHPLDYYYSVLNVNKNMPFEEIKKAYHKMAMKNHPDRLGPDATPKEIEEANERLVEINDAYKMLSEKLKC